jgi:hypothetical protein
MFDYVGYILTEVFKNLKFWYFVNFSLKNKENQIVLSPPGCSWANAKHFCCGLNWDTTYSII